MLSNTGLGGQSRGLLYALKVRRGNARSSRKKLRSAHVVFLVVFSGCNGIPWHTGNYSGIKFFTEFYLDDKESISSNAPEARGNVVQKWFAFVDADHANDRCTSSSHTGNLLSLIEHHFMVLCEAKHRWSATFWFVALRTASDIIPAAHSVPSLPRQGMG